MTLRHVGTTLASALVVLGMALPAAAQVATGTVSGTVKDAQGGVIPGATVTLTNERQGTSLAPAVTSSTGDYVFPNVPTGTYTVEVAMTGFTSSKRTGVAVSAGDRVSVQPFTLDVGGDDRDDQGHGRSAADPVAERRALVHHHRRRRREPADPEPHVQRARGAGARHEQYRRQQPGAAGRRRREQRHVRRHRHHRHRQQLDSADDEHGGGRGSQGARLELPGRVRPVERRPDLRGHQERHEPVPRLRLRHRAQFRLEQQQLGEQAQRQSEDDLEREGLGLLDRRSGREARAAATSCSSSSARSGVRGRPADRSPGSACRPSSNGRAIFRSRGTTTAPSSRTSATTRPGSPCSAADTTRLLPGRRRRRQNPAEPALRDRPERAEVLAAAERQRGLRGDRQLQLSEHQADGGVARPPGSGSRRLPVLAEAARQRQAAHAGQLDGAEQRQHPVRHRRRRRSFPASTT